ncbi:response regulator transcription factor [Arthrobacter sp. NamB2]|uniref:response regulator transcription factor n=1 Tax=Arthrobacter sp. NamB2 TaxID=2576035 RepID=UPI0010CA05CE|nr:response regulator transcription factor [Arthrobacter sp. NamB2]
MFTRLTESRAAETGETKSLTARGLEVRDLVAEGLADKQIATRLAISVKTVEKHVSAMLRKTGAHNRTMLVGLQHQVRQSRTPGRRRRRSSAYVLRRHQHACWICGSEKGYDPAAVASRMNRAVSCGWSQCGKCPQSSKTCRVASG